MLLATLEHQWRQPPGFMGNLSPDTADCPFSEPWPVLDRRTTVKDLLKIRRQMVEDEIFLKRQVLEQCGTPDAPQHVDTEVNMAATHCYENSTWSYLSQDKPEFEVQMGPPDLCPEPMDPNPHTPLSFSAAPSSTPPMVQSEQASPVWSSEQVCPAPPMVPSEQVCPSPPMVPSGQTCPVGLGAGASLGSTLFHWQIQEQFKRIKAVPPEVLNMRDQDGDTPLHIAVAQGKRPLTYVVAAIMSANGTLDTPERNGQTALHIAAATNQPLIVSDLLEHGAQVYRRDTWGRSPLQVCVEKGHVESLVAMLNTLKTLGKEVDVDMVNYDSLTSLHMAVLSHNAVLRELRGLRRATGSCKERRHLLKTGEKLYKCIKALLENGASIVAKDEKSGRTSVHMAAEEANTDLLSLLLSHPSTPTVVNLQTYSGNTALHIVCALQDSKAQLEAVKMLMRSGADPGARNIENEFPYQLLPEGGAAERVRQVLRGKYLQM